MNAPSTLPAPAALQLFLRHLAGQIGGGTWNRFVRAYESAAATAEERSAYAQFVNDAVRDLGASAVPVPKPEEMDDLLALARAA